MRIIKFVAIFFIIYTVLLFAALGLIFSVNILSNYDANYLNEILYFTAAFHAIWTTKLALIFIFLLLYILRQINIESRRTVEIATISILVIANALIFGKIFGFYYALASLIFFLVYNLLKNIPIINTQIFYTIGLVFTFCIVMNYGLNNVFGTMGVIALIVLFFIYYFVLANSYRLILHEKK
jgi:hypothetical protein